MPRARQSRNNGRPPPEESPALNPEPVRNRDQDPLLTQLSTMMQNMNATVSALSDQVGNLNTEVRTLRTQVENLQTEITGKDETIRNLENKITKKDDIIRTLKIENKRKDTEIIKKDKFIEISKKMKDDEKNGKFFLGIGTKVTVKKDYRGTCSEELMQGFVITFEDFEFLVTSIRTKT